MQKSPNLIEFNPEMISSPHNILVFDSRFVRLNDPYRRGIDHVPYS